MVSLNLPAYTYRIEKRRGKLVIFDPIRKKFVTLSPEEWVRQHFINYLTQHLGYPSSRMRVESSTLYNSLVKRSDILVFDDELKPLVLVECKAASVSIGPSAFEQIGIYNKSLHAKVIICTNGMVHYAGRYHAHSGKTEFLDALPSFYEVKKIR